MLIITFVNLWLKRKASERGSAHIYSHAGVLQTALDYTKLHYRAFHCSLRVRTCLHNLKTSCHTAQIATGHGF